MVDVLGVKCKTICNGDFKDLKMKEQMTPRDFRHHVSILKVGFSLCLFPGVQDCELQAIDIPGVVQ